MGSSLWGTRRRRVILIVGAGLITAWYLILLGAFVLAPQIKNVIQARAVEALRRDFASDVRLQSFDVSFFPRVHATAGGVVIGNKKTGALIQAATAEAQSSWLPWHIRNVTLRGLYLRIPTVRGAATQASQPASNFEIGELAADDAHIDILPANGQEKPVRFELAHLRVKNFNPSRAAEFSASVLSSQPRADIEASGRLGPWNAQYPSLTPLQGAYTMPRCDLASVPGLKGALSSQGQFRGVLQRIEVSGDADASQFSLSVSGRPEPLHATVRATVDASDGSASIDAIEGTLQRSSFRASGRVRNVQDDRTRSILLELSMNPGRIEDVLILGVKSPTSAISGDLRVHGKLEILPGDQDILDRLRLDATFAAANARFSSLDWRERLRSLSRKAEGHPNDAAAGSSVSSMQGDLQVTNGLAQFSSLVFNLEGASARLSGSYQIAGERLDFHGELRMEAKLSQTATGPKAFFLKAADPFFRSKGGGSQVPIKITGTQTDPAFALDIGK